MRETKRGLRLDLDNMRELYKDEYKKRIQLEKVVESMKEENKYLHSKIKQ